MFFRYHQTFICIAFFFIHLPLSNANDEAIQLGLNKVDLSSDMDGWVPVTQSKQIHYGEWITTGGGGGGVPNGWGGIWEQTTTLVWEDYKTVTSNKFERAVFPDGENGLRVRSIDPFVPSNATRYTQQVINSYIVSPRIDLSKNNQDHLIFQYKSNSYITLDLWIGKNDGSYWHSIWEDNQNLVFSHAITRNVGNGFREVKINLENALMDLNLQLTNNGFANDVISPQTDRIYITFVAQDNAIRWSGTSTQVLEIKSIWTPSYYGDGRPQQTSIDPTISFDYKNNSVTFYGGVGETYELHTSADLKEWQISRSFTLTSDSETHPISDFQDKSRRRSFFRLKHKP
tara:strand:+ start:204 stop:1235 length:1032 start_codon:yes stop_codon:yes gene_type:complete